MSKRYGLSATQQSFLSESVRNPNGGLGILQLVLSFEELFHPEAFHRALQYVVDRHDSLRKAFPLSGGSPYQIVLPQANVAQSLLDWKPLPPPAQQHNFELFLQTDRHTPFDVETAPLLRSSVLVYRPDFAKVVLTLHHLIVDGQSLQIVLSELVRVYDAFRQSSLPRLSPPVSDVDYLESLSQAHSLETQRYWEGLLRQTSPGRYLTSLQNDRQHHGAGQQQVSITLGPSELKHVKQAAIRYAIAVPTLAYGAWALTLHRYSQAEDILFLATRRGRSLALPGMEHAVGCFINTVLVRATIDRRSPADVWLRQLEDQWRAGAAHEHASLADVQSWQKWDTGAFAWDTNFVYRHDSLAAAFARSAPPGARRHAVLLQHSDFPLTVAVTRSQSLCLQMHYRASLFRPGAVDSLLESYATVLMDLAYRQDSSLNSIRYLSDNQQEFLSKSAGSFSPQGSEELLHQGFETQARLHPSRVALYDENGSLTYGELDRLSRRLAAELLAGGLLPEEPVGVLLPRSRHLLVALLATLRAGGCYLPLELAHSNEVLQVTVSKAGVHRLLTQPCHSSRVDVIAPEDTLIITIDDHTPAAYVTLPPCTPAQLAYLIPTSGSTGGPKLVEIEHRAAANTIRHSIDHIYEPSNLSLVPWLDSPAFDAGIHQVFAPLSIGGSLVLVEGMEALPSSPWWNRLTAFGATPSVLMGLLNTGAIPPRAETVMFGGESFPARLPHLLSKHPRLRKAVNVYGPAEASIYCTAIDTLPSVGSEAEHSGRNIGKPVRNTFVTLLDESLQPVPPGAQGEIYVGGRGLARGYRGEADLTQQRFVSIVSPDGISRRVYRTGDLGLLLPDGNLEFCGRVDRQVKVAGIRIELEGVEEALQAAVDVQLAVAFVAELNGASCLCACIQTTSAICPQSLLAFVRQRLPKGMAPKHIYPLRRIPLTPNGKPDLAVLKKIALQPANGASAFRPPCDPHTSAVVKVWEELLGHSNFNVHDDFYSVGGDSLLALHLVLRLGLDMFPSQTWTVHAMAQALVSPRSSGHLVRVGASAINGRFWIMPFQSDIASLGANAHESFWAMSAQMESIVDSSRHISDLADTYMQDIKRVQPNGPYFIGGFCFGGYLAFELATRLESEGQQVTLLLLDRPGPSVLARKLDALVSPWRSLANQIQLGCRHTNLSNLASYLSDGIKSKWRSRGGGSMSQAAAAALAYRPQSPFQGRLILVESRYSRFPFPSLLPRRGWEDLSAGPLEIVQRPDHVQTFGPQEWSEICLFQTGAPAPALQSAS